MSRLSLLMLILGLSACRHGQTVEAPQPAAVEPRSWALTEAPSEWAPALRQADAAITALQSTLLKRLLTALEQSAPEGALGACTAEAQPLTEGVVQDQGISVGRTSHKLRNPRNAPRPWATAYVASHAGKRAGEVDTRVFDLGDVVGVLRPIAVGGMCLTCHGENLAAPLTRALKASYPDDQARGFQEGALRGFFWAEVPKKFDTN
jgi:hypothetical protein